MYKDFYDYDHPALYLYLVEQRGASQAWRSICHRPQTKRDHKAMCNRKVRRVIRQYLNHANEPCIDTRAAGDGWDIA